MRVAAKPTMTPNTAQTEVTRAVLGWMRHNELGASEMARRLGSTADRVSKWQRGVSNVPIDDLPEIERSLGLPLGYFLREAGYVEERQGLVAAIANEPQLSEYDKALLTAVVQWMRGSARRKAATQPRR